MHLINWLNLQPSQADLDALTKDISEPLLSRIKFAKTWLRLHFKAILGKIVLT